MLIRRITDKSNSSGVKRIYHRIRYFKPGRLHGPDVVWEFINRNQVNYLTDRIFESYVWYVSGNILEESDEITLESTLGSKFIFGPNIQFEDDSIRNFILQIPDYRVVVPSDWVSDYFRNSNFFPSEKIIIWPTGINLEFWKEDSFPRRKRNVIIYIKGVHKEEHIETALSVVRLYGFSPVIVKYGTYNIYSYRRKLRSAIALLHFGTTESQGISLLESWACNVPTAVYANNSYFDYRGTAHVASSAPYLDDSTGMFLIPSLDLELQLKDFLSRLEGFSPRESVDLRFETGNVFNLLKTSLKTELD